MEEPDERYAYDGAPVLNDGKLGRGTYNSGRWLGFYGKPLDAFFDLKEPQQMARVRFHANVNKGAWIYNPRKATVRISNDGHHFMGVCEKEFPISGWEENDGVFCYELLFEPVKARYVEVLIEGFDLPEDHSGYGNPAWLFVDEIEVF